MKFLLPPPRCLWEGGEPFFGMHRSGLCIIFTVIFMLAQCSVAQQSPSALPVAPVSAGESRYTATPSAWSLEPGRGAKHLEAPGAEHLFHAYGDFHSRAVARTLQSGGGLPPVLLCQPMYVTVSVSFALLCVCSHVTTLRCTHWREISASQMCACASVGESV